MRDKVQDFSQVEAKHLMNYLPNEESPIHRHPESNSLVKLKLIKHIYMRHPSNEQIEEFGHQGYYHICSLNHYEHNKSSYFHNPIQDFCFC